MKEADEILDFDTFQRLEKMYEKKENINDVDFFKESKKPTVDTEKTETSKVEIVNDKVFDNAVDNSKSLELYDGDKILVHRPHKNFKWGLGEQIKRKRGKNSHLFYFFITFINFSQIYFWKISKC